ncbi:MAG: putative adenosine monophosphate-protein transferase fic [Firmicutes bacterium ADurb.Bin182]|nr:MAG: putative adenosine monophosphate-protein transferase fic [Firmicutes bacterium ADurb.Bin182]
MSDYFYNYEYDKTYCYPSSSVLKNKLNIQDASDLLKAERNITALRILELKMAPPKGSLNFDYLRKLHFYIFQDIYTWAGEIRTVDITKGTKFCLFRYIEEQANDLFRKLKNENYLIDTKESIERRLSFYLSEINAIHPFREGNGRVQRLFIEILADRAGYEVDFSVVTAEEMITASYQSFHKNYEPMDELFRRITCSKAITDV